MNEIKNNNVSDKFESVNNNFEYDMNMKKIREEIIKKFDEYRSTLNFMVADAPIEILCLSKIINKVLVDNGLLRIYDLFDCDFTKIEGLSESNIRHLTTCLDKFFSML